MSKKFYTQIEMYAPVSNAKDVTTKEYVDLLVLGKIKEPVVAATTVALPASTYLAGVLTADANGALPAIDGVTLIATNRLLVKNQADQTQNGIYVVTQVGDAGTPFILTRAADMDSSQDLSHNLIVPVMQGTSQADDRFQLISDGTLTLDTTALVFAKYYTTTGATVATGTISGDDVTTDFVITHNLNSKDVVVKVYETDAEIGVDIETTTVNTATVSFGIAPTSAQSFNVVVIG